MYVYFDKKGVLKEIINDTIIRKGNDNVNSVYVYFEGLENFITGVSFSVLKNGASESVMRVGEKVVKSIPYEESREDLRYFKLEKDYNFYMFTLDLSLLDTDGLLQITTKAISETSVLASGLILVNVEESVVKVSTSMTESDFSYINDTLTRQQGYIDNKLEILRKNESNIGLDEFKVNTPTIVAFDYNKTYSIYNYKDNALNIYAPRIIYKNLVLNVELLKNGETITLTSEELETLKREYSYTKIRINETSLVSTFSYYVYSEKKNNELIFKATRIDNHYNELGFSYLTLSNDTLTYHIVYIAEKDNYYTKEEVLQEISKIYKNSYKIVDSLASALPNEGVMYLVGTTAPYDIYIYENGNFVNIGSTDIDMSNYYSKEEIDNLLISTLNNSKAYATRSLDSYVEISTLANYYTKSEIDNAFVSVGALANKQDKLVDNYNIATINGETLLTQNKNFDLVDSATYESDKDNIPSKIVANGKRIFLANGSGTMSTSGEVYFATINGKSVVSSTPTSEIDFELSTTPVIYDFGNATSGSLSDKDIEGLCTEYSTNKVKVMVDNNAIYLTLNKIMVEDEIYVYSTTSLTTINSSQVLAIYTFTIDKQASTYVLTTNYINL